MGRPSKRPKISTEEVDANLGAYRVKAKRWAVALLRRCLDSHLLPANEVELYLRDLSLAVGLPSEAKSPSTAENESQVDKADATASAVPAPAPAPTPTPTPSLKKSKASDEHNEVCEVCERGGDLICCDTCSLVFHVKCLRPKIASVPKGNWSCAYCILDGVADGDKQAAKQSIKAMSRLMRGVDSEDDQAPSETEQQALRLAKTGEITIAHSGRKYIVRRTARRQIVELGRFSSLEEALISVASVQTARRTPSKASSSRAGEQDEELWCTYCLDDPSIQLCAFCGCKACFGKFDTHLLVLCDECDRETHTYCLQPPLSSVPATEPWYCETCSSAMPKASHVRTATSIATSTQPTSIKGDPVPVYRGRGRPPGSRTRQKESQQPVGSRQPPKKYKLKRSQSLSGNSTASLTSEASTDRKEIVTLGDLLERLSQASIRAFDDEDLQALEYHRTWSTLPELQILYKALQRQQQLIAAKLQLSDGDISLPDQHEALLFKEVMGGEYDLEISNRNQSELVGMDIAGFPEMANASQEHAIDEHPYLAPSTSPDMLLNFKEDDYLLLASDHLSEGGDPHTGE